MRLRRSGAVEYGDPSPSLAARLQGGEGAGMSSDLLTKPELALLEKAFAAEIDAALGGSAVHVIQSKSKVAAKLVEDGLLERATMNLGRRDALGAIIVNGLQLTHAGRFAYCSTCTDEDEAASRLGSPKSPKRRS
jgi:hypothetical protein